MTQKDGQQKAQSPELAGGAGFTFADAVSASYLEALLSEGYARGIKNGTVSRVALEQRNFGEPLDDLIVDFRDISGAPARLSLQVKSDLRISAAKTNNDFREVIRDSWRTYQKIDFRKNVDRYGAAVGEVAKEKSHDLKSLCDLARESVTTDHFETRFREGGGASKELKQIKADIVALLVEAKGIACTEAEVHEFLAHFVLVEFDFLHEGAADPADILTRLRDCLAADQASQAPALWATLRQMARDSAGKSGEFDRPRLVRELSRSVRLRTAPSLRSDLEKLTVLSRSWIADIQNDVAGTHLDRPALAAKLEKSMTGSRFVQIRGLPGSGKSVLLRQRVEVDLARGPIIFLKNDRLEGKGWSSFAAANGLSAASLENLLAEIGSTGSDTLYIDGIDRIEKEHQPIVLDILRAILGSPLLNNWKIVVSLRDTGIEPLRNWFGEVLNAMSIATVEVNELDNDEAELLATAKPALRALLFGSAQVREIVRRPFFAKVLSQSLGIVNGGPPFEPQSEVDLIENWWTRGGYDAVGQNAIVRQSAIIEIGAIRARQLSQPVSLSQLTAATTSLIEQLVVDGILQHVRQGHTVRFSHDIFFEWSFFHVLSDRGDKWLEEIRECGEPPVVARVVELMSQCEYEQGKSWTATLHLIASAKMRSQWTRAWLLGPLGTAAFEKNESQFSEVVMADECRLLKKALVWFQAEKTTPNPNILASDLPQDQRIRFADILGWPSDFTAWRRLIDFLLTRIDTIPIALYPDVVSVFEVWQNALAGMKNRISHAILTQSTEWLRAIDKLDDIKMPTEASPWNLLKELDDFRRSLSRLILRSAVTVPELTEEYLKRIIASKRLREDKFKEIIDFSPTLSGTHPQLLVDLTLKHLKEELPDDQVAREEKEMRTAAEMRKKALAKPESERTRRDNAIITGSFSPLGFQQFSYHDWDRLSMNDDSQNFWPPSPLREPFHSLFKVSPEHAIRLFNELCNHAVTAWRQLHRHIDDSGTPLPLEIQFPWGVQQFWGGDREYLWHRGLSAPKVIACGFMALEEWCFAELERGRPVDELIQQIVEGNQGVAILGIASTLALHTERLSETVFPIVTAQRLWFVDRNRMVQDMSGLMVNLMGFHGSNDLPHINAIKAAAARDVRKKELRWLAPLYVLSKDFGERASATIIGFQDNLPFQIEEHRNNPSACEHLKNQALEYAELADKKNYRATKPANEDELVEVMHVSPSASKPENVAKAERAALGLQEGSLWAWVSKAFENKKVDDPLNVPIAIKLAQKLDSTPLYEAADDEENLGMRRGAVAAAAALVLHFREGRTATELEWARDVLARAIRAPEKRDVFWTAMAVIPWHQCIFVARGLAADLRNGTGDTETAVALLTLVFHPLEVVSLAALEQTASLWEKDAKLAWAALHLAFTLCHIEPRPHTQPAGPGEPIHLAEWARKALNAAITYYRNEKGWPDLPLPPPAWVKVEKSTEAGQGAEHEFDEDDIEAPDETWTAPTTHWHSQYASKILARVPYEQILASDARGQILTFITGVLQWTNEKNSPPWVKKGRRDRESLQIFEWTHALGGTLGGISGMLALAEVRPQFLEPIFVLEGDTCWALLASFVSTYICRYVYDAQTVPDDAIGVLSLCLERLLKAPSFSRSSHRSGEFYGFDEPNLVKSLMFVSVERATLAARYVNGDWAGIQLILPLIDRFIRAGGWSGTVMSHFLTLCERSKSAYPAEMFADQILAVIGDGSEALKGWHGTFIPARIASLVQHFADRDTPVVPNLGQKLLRILDLLVDMGDRRSAALQLSESFREIKMT